jgi:hypothetical protein
MALPASTSRRELLDRRPDDYRSDRTVTYRGDRTDNYHSGFSDRHAAILMNKSSYARRGPEAIIAPSDR